MKKSKYILILVIIFIFLLLFYLINTNKKNNDIKDSAPIIDIFKINVATSDILSVTLFNGFAHTENSKIKKVIITIYDENYNYIMSKSFNYQDNIDYYKYDFRLKNIVKCIISIKVIGENNQETEKMFFRNIGYLIKPNCNVYYNYLKCDISESYNLKFSKDEGKTWYEYDKEINIDSKNIIVSAYNNYELNYITYNFINY